MAKKEKKQFSKEEQEIIKREQEKRAREKKERARKDKLRKKRMLAKERKQKRKEKEERKKINKTINLPHRILLHVSLLVTVLYLIFSSFGPDKKIEELVLGAFLVFIFLYFGLGLIMFSYFWIKSDEKKKEFEILKEEEAREESERIEEEIAQEKKEKDAERERWRKAAMKLPPGERKPEPVTETEAVAAEEEFSSPEIEEGNPEDMKPPDTEDEIPDDVIAMENEALEREFGKSSGNETPDPMARQSSIEDMEESGFDIPESEEDSESEGLLSEDDFRDIMDESGEASDFEPFPPLNQKEKA